MHKNASTLETFARPSFYMSKCFIFQHVTGKEDSNMAAVPHEQANERRGDSNSAGGSITEPIVSNKIEP